MSIIHGSMGLIYFVHEWQPKFDESALLSDPEMLAAVSQTNHQIAELAPVLNSPTVADGAKAASINAECPRGDDGQEARRSGLRVRGGDAGRAKPGPGSRSRAFPAPKPWKSSARTARWT